MAKKIKEKKPLYSSPVFILFLCLFSVVLLLGVAVLTSYYGVGMARDEPEEANGEVALVNDIENNYEDEAYEEQESELLPIEPRPDIRGFLSRFEYNDHTAYILGSMHMGRANWFPLSPMVEDAMTSADVFAFEFDLGMMAAIDDLSFAGTAEMLVDVLELVQIIFELSVLPDGMTLEDVLSEESFANFYEMLETFPGISYDEISDMTPFAVSMMISDMISDELGGLYIDYSVDTYVFNFASEHNRAIVGLNSVISELTLMFDIPLEIQAYIFDDFTDFETTVTMMIQMMEEMIEAYVTGDDDAIRYLVHTPTDTNPYVIFSHEVFLQRCNIFGEEILTLLRETEEPTTFFITVGAAHVLYGHIFGMLEAEGIIIEELWR